MSEPKEKPTKDDLFIGKVGIIAGLNQSGSMSDREAMERIHALTDEYTQEESPAETLRRVFGAGKKGG